MIVKFVNFFLILFSSIIYSLFLNRLFQKYQLFEESKSLEYFFTHFYPFNNFFIHL